MDVGEPTSYITLDSGAPVYSSDETQLGEVRRVLADPDRDIFDGIVVATAGGERYVEAAAVREIFERGVVLELSAAEASQLPRPGAG